MATIKNIGVKCDSRSQARALAKTLVNGRVIDMAKRYTDPVARWVVLSDKVVNIQPSLQRNAKRFIENSSCVKSGSRNVPVMNRKAGFIRGALMVREQVAA